MNEDLERLIALQRLDSQAQDAQRRVADGPERLSALDARLAAVAQRVAAAKEQLTQSQQTRRGIEKELAVHQGRLSKFRDQLMSVKTNVEYQAMQKEIGFAQSEIKALEDRILELMLEADDLAAAVKRSDAELASEQKTVDADRRAAAAEVAESTASVERLAKERVALVGSLDPQAFNIFDMVARRRNGVAVAEARDGICTICHVRLRPQIFNTVRRNEAIIQCDSCQRILYFTPSTSPPAGAADATQPAR